MSIAPVDPNVRIPAAVKAAAARSEAYFQNDANAPQPEPQATENPSAASEAPAAPVAEATFGITSAAPAPQPGDAPPVGDQPPVDEASWQHRYNSMKGRFDKSNELVSQLTEQVKGLQQVIATMQINAPTSTPPELRAEKLLTAEEESDYGAEFLNVVGKKAREELTPIIKGYEQKIAELEGKLQGVGTHIVQSARDQMFQQLGNWREDWRDINRSDEFKQWLALPDAYSGVTRHDLLKAAYERNDSPRVLAFFKGFLAEEAATSPAPAAGQNSGAPAPAVDLAALAAPGRAKTAAGTTPAEKPIITRAQIAEFYAQVNSGRFKGRDAEKNSMEAQIFEAQREGRIR